MNPVAVDVLRAPPQDNLDTAIWLRFSLNTVHFLTHLKGSYSCKFDLLPCMVGLLDRLIIGHDFPLACVGNPSCAGLFRSRFSLS